MKGWQKKFDTNDGEIDLWRTMWPNAINTGILCRFTPCLDVDILSPEAAYAAEDYVRGRHEEYADIIVRIGRPPKRAIPFRTEAPFKKIAVNLIAPNGDTSQKLEFLADGQQCVVDGIHPDINKPYAWFGKNIADVPHDELPNIDAAEARRLITELADLLVREHGYQISGGKPKNDDDGASDPDRADWAELATSIIKGRELHDSTVSLAAS
jgi:hypothetical protein